MNSKKILYSEYNQEAEKVRAQLREQVGPYITIVDMGSTRDHPEIEMGVSWYATGTVTPDEARAFAVNLMKAAVAAQSFKYNGYVVI